MADVAAGGVFTPLKDQVFGLSVTGQGSILSTAPVTSGAGGAGVGYAAGAGGAVTQLTNKSTAVTLNTMCGTITMNNASLSNATAVAFTLNNSNIAATDVVNVSIKGTATTLTYLVGVQATAAGSCSIVLYNYSASPQSEAVAINFAICKSVAA